MSLTAFCLECTKPGCCDSKRISTDSETNELICTQYDCTLGICLCDDHQDIKDKCPNCKCLKCRSIFADEMFCHYCECPFCTAKRGYNIDNNCIICGCSEDEGCMGCVNSSISTFCKTCYCRKCKTRTSALFYIMSMKKLSEKEAYMLIVSAKTFSHCECKTCILNRA